LFCRQYAASAEAALAATGSPTVFSQECFVDEIAPQLVRVARVAGPTLPDA